VTKLSLSTGTCDRQTAELFSTPRNRRRQGKTLMTCFRAEVQYVKRNETPSGFFSRVKKSPAVYRSQVQVPVERLNVTIHNETALTLHREIDR